MIDIFIEGIPKAQPRTRAVSRNGKGGVYDPGTANGWKMIVALALKEFHGAMLSGPIHLEAIFYLPRPKRLMRKKDPEWALYHTAKPDCDNLIKAVMDSMSDCRIWVDDRQVCSQIVKKYYASKTGTTGVKLSVFERTDDGLCG